jgi:hypothetical protein
MEAGYRGRFSFWNLLLLLLLLLLQYTAMYPSVSCGSDIIVHEGTQGRPEAGSEGCKENVSEGVDSHR